MVTDDQRREVAQELRKLTAPGCIRYAEEFYEELREIVARDLDGSFEGVANSLADLIDRPTCTMTYKPEWSGDEIYPTTAYQCSNCGCVVNEGITEYCPDCGCRVSNFETETER